MNTSSEAPSAASTDSKYFSTGPNLAKSTVGHGRRLSEPPPVTLPVAAGRNLAVLLDDQDLVPQWHALAATVLTPSSPAKPHSPLVSLLVVLRRALPQDAEASVLQILRNLTSSSSAEAPTRLQQASELLRDLNRPQAGLPDRHGTPLSPEDQKQLWKDLSQTLTDPQRGAQRLLDILRSRTPS